VTRHDLSGQQNDSGVFYFLKSFVLVGLKMETF
jgi:hypothetical protein